MMLLTNIEDVARWAAGSEKRAYYYSHHVGTIQIEQILARLHGDDAYGLAGRLDKPATYLIGSGPKVRVLSPSEKWVPNTSGALPTLTGPEKTQMLLDEIWEHCKVLGYAGKEGLPSPGSISKRILIKSTSYIGEGELGPQRALAYRAVHQGPMVAASGGHADAHLYDRSAAFLHGMYKQVPIGLVPLVFPRLDGVIVSYDGSTCKDRHLALARRALDGSGPGFIEADVLVKEHHFPTLPFNSDIGAIYACGYGSGCWSMQHLRAEIEAGNLELLEVKAVYTARRALSLYARAADEMAKAVQLSNKKLKPLYVTGWGGLCTDGHGIKLVPSRPSEDWIAKNGAKVDRTWGHSWWAVRLPRPSEWQPQGVLCRPEHAVEIAGSNAAEVSSTVAINERHGVVVHGAMTDSIWLDCPMTRPGWKLEAGGDGFNLRQFSAGNNFLLSPAGEVVRYRAMGCTEVWNPKQAEADWRRCRPDVNRIWSGKPQDWQNGHLATSRPRIMDRPDADGEGEAEAE